MAAIVLANQKHYFQKCSFINLRKFLCNAYQIAAYFILSFQFVHDAGTLLGTSTKLNAGNS